MAYIATRSLEESGRIIRKSFIMYYWITGQCRCKGSDIPLTGVQW